MNCIVLSLLSIVMSITGLVLAIASAICALRTRRIYKNLISRHQP